MLFKSVIGATSGIVIFVICMLFFIFIVVIINAKRVGTNEFDERWGEAYANIDASVKFKRYYTVIFLVIRIVFTLTILRVEENAYA